MDYDYLIIGAGCIGLSTAEILSRSHFRVLVIEKENRIGTGISSRNSEVIHAGVYYPRNSLKSLLCIRGKQLLYEWCEKFRIPYKRIGKYIIATNKDEQEKLEAVKKNANDSDMNDLFPVKIGELKIEEPNVSCQAALWSPTTGILSVHNYMDSLKIIAEENGADFLFNSRLVYSTKNSQSTGYLVGIKDSSQEVTEIEVGGIINCGGLYSDKISQLLGTFEDGYGVKFVKGNYFKLRKGKGIFNHLIYPVPMPKLYGLGIHVTLDLNGEIRFGPDVEFLTANIEDYIVNERRTEEFYNSILKYYPKLKIENLQVDMAGIRPKLIAEKHFNDFIIKEESSKGFPKIINCIGIESPGITSSRAIGEYILSQVS